MKKHNINEVEESPETPQPDAPSPDTSAVGPGASAAPSMPTTGPSPSLDASLGTDPLGSGLDPQNVENKPVDSQKIKSLNVWDLLKDYVKDRQK